MNRESPWGTDFAHNGGLALAIASRSWRPRPGATAPNELPSGSRRVDSAGLSGSWTDSRRSAILPVIDMFTQAWERGDAPAAEDYLSHLDPSDSDGAVELIYREFCLAEADGQGPDPSHYLARFPGQREALERLLHLHGECPTSMLGRWFQPTDGEAALPEAGDSIGPYVLRRELGRGSFARVFLAEEADLENRLVVVKVSTRVTREPWLLARAQHAHIVKILQQYLVNDGAFQLICMPFFGGATLGAVLDVGRRRPRAARTGRELLEDLDRASAPEYPGEHDRQPAREILARLSYDRAIAWVVARLAEALDHAFAREIAHGDVKPSNILLSADGNPMLLDFNLARDGALAVDDPGRGVDPGGTLAYMAPERLRALASADRPLDVNIAGPDRTPSPTDGAPHLADLYSLGMVLLEAMTGRPPVAIKVPDGQGPGSRGMLKRSAARAYASSRERSARSIVRDSEVAGSRAIAPGLKAILERCLDPDPSRRYGRSLELAEDLDRWRTDRTLAYTDEPFWGLTVPRWLRRQRPALIVAAASLLAVTLVATAIFLRESNLIRYQNAVDKVSQFWDDIEALGFQRPQNVRFLKPDDRQAIELARRVLKHYEILNPSGVPGTGDWRRRDDVRRLPAADREDLEVWIMERAYRYCLSLDHRPNSPGDWGRALKILDSVSGAGPTTIRAFEPLRNRLLAKLGAGLAKAPARPSPESAPAWLDEHLLGFVIECEPQGGDTPPAQRREAERALLHYVQLAITAPRFLLGTLSRGGHLLRPGSGRRSRRLPPDMPGATARERRAPRSARRLPDPTQSLSRGPRALRRRAGEGARPGGILSDPRLRPREVGADRRPPRRDPRLRDAERSPAPLSPARHGRRKLAGPPGPQRAGRAGRRATVGAARYPGQGRWRARSGGDHIPRVVGPGDPARRGYRTRPGRDG